MIQKPKTEELEEAKEVVRRGVKKVEDFFPKKTDVKIGFGWTERDFIKKNMNGASGLTLSAEYFEIDFNSNVENWKTSILGTSVHEYAHTYFYEAKAMDAEDSMPMWMYILSEALTLNTTEKLVPESPEPWRTEHSKEDITEYWKQIKEEELERPYEYPDPLFIDKSEDGYPNWLGYSLAYLIGKQLLEEGHKLEEFPDLSEKDVINTGDKLFNDEDTA